MNALANDLQAGCEILWYQVESVLGRGGFGITYLAMDNNLGQLVAIKEYLPHEFGTRSGDSTVQPISVAQNEVYNWGLERFMTEAQTLAKFKHPNIVRVLSVFKENNTGYMVMEYEQGEDLSAVYKRKWNLSQSELEGIYYPIIDGLASVHKEGFIHRDIKPANIYIRSDGSPVLLDFGAARQAVGTKTKTLTSMLSIGYAPFEQYNDAQGKQGPWTDIYALGASLHQGITGEKPMEATIRGMAMVHQEPDPYKPLSQSNIEGYTPAFLRAIDEALMMQMHDRPQILEEFLCMLKGEIKLPDLPNDNALASDETVVRSKTVVRPRNKKPANIDATDSDKYAKTEIIAPSAKDSLFAANAASNQQTPDSRSARQGTSRKAIFLFAAIAIVGIAIAVVIFFPGINLLESIPTQTAEELQTGTPEEIQAQKVDSLLKKADKLIASGKYYDKNGSGALSTYQQILAIEPGNSSAKSGIDKVSQHYLTESKQLINNKDFVQADASLEIVNSIDPAFPGLNQAKQQLTVGILVKKADALITNGQYYDKSGNGALSAYQQVLAIESDNSAAKSGINKVAQHYLKEAEQFIDYKDFAQANASLKIVNTIDPAFPGLKNALSRTSENLDIEKKYEQIELLLSQASNALDRGQVYQPKQKSAIFYYQNVLKIEKDNVSAQLGLLQIADGLIDDAQKALNRNDIKIAEKLVSLVESINPDKTGIKTIRGQIDTINELNNVLAKADKAYANNRYTTPKNDNAYDLFTRVLTIEPSNQHAQEHLNKIADYYVDKTQNYIRAEKIDSAKSSLKTLTTYFPDNSKILNLSNAISNKQKQINAANEIKKKPAPTSKVNKIVGLVTDIFKNKDRQLLPARVNQKQDDNQVVQDIVGLFIEAVKDRDIDGLLAVSQMTDQQQSLYTSIFKLYQSMNIKVAPNSFSLSKKSGVASIKFEIIDLTDSKGNSVVTSANWTKIELKISKKNDSWQKAEII